MNEKHLTLDVFEAMYAPAHVEIDAGSTIDAHELVMSQLTEDQRALVDDCRSFSRSDYQIKFERHFYDAQNIRSQQSAADNLEQMQKAVQELKRCIAKAEAMQEYYKHLAAILAATEKTPIFVLSRNCNRWGDKKVTYTISRGYYDVNTRQPIITDRAIEAYEGKQHREAHAALAKLVKAESGSRGYEIHNEYYSHIDYDKPAVA